MEQAATFFRHILAKYAERFLQCSVERLVGVPYVDPGSVRHIRAGGVCPRRRTGVGVVGLAAGTAGADRRPADAPGLPIGPVAAWPYRYRRRMMKDFTLLEQVHVSSSPALQIPSVPKNWSLCGHNRVVPLVRVGP